MKHFFSGVVREDLDKVWHVVAPMIMRAIATEESFVTLQSIYDGLQTQDMQLWIFAVEGTIKACMVTEIRTYRKTRVAFILVLGGSDFGVWKDARGSWDLFELWAGRAGCEYIEALTRPGVRKLTQDLGLIRCHELVRKKLSPITTQ